MTMTAAHMPVQSVAVPPAAVRAIPHRVCRPCRAGAATPP